MTNILSLIATVSIIYIVVCFVYGMALMARKYLKAIPVELIVVVFSVLVFLCMEVLVSPHKFEVLNMSHLVSSNILSVFFFGVFLDVLVKTNGYIEVSNKNVVYYVLSRAVPEFLISQNLLWYMLHNLNYDYSVGITLNVMLWCLIMIQGDIYYKCSKRTIIYHCLDVIIQLSAGGYLYLVSGNILLPIVLVVCSTLIVESRRNLN